MPLQVVPTFEDLAQVRNPVDPSVPIVWGVAPQLDLEAVGGEIFVFNDAGQMILANEAQSLEQLITKSMITERLMYAVYDANFGSDFWMIIGKNISDLAIETLAKGFVVDAVKPIDLVRYIDQIVAEVRGDILYLGFRAISIGGHELEFSFARTIR